MHSHNLTSVFSLSLSPYFSPCMTCALTCLLSSMYLPVKVLAYASRAHRVQNIYLRFAATRGFLNGSCAQRVIRVTRYYRRVSVEEEEEHYTPFNLQCTRAKCPAWKHCKREFFLMYTINSTLLLRGYMHFRLYHSQF